MHETAGETGWNHAKLGGRFFFRSLVFFSPLFPLFLLDFPVEQSAQEPTSFSMHQEDVRTARPRSFHSSRFRWVRDSACTYSKTRWIKGKGQRRVESNVPFFPSSGEYLLNFYRDFIISIFATLQSKNLSVKSIYINRSTESVEEREVYSCNRWLRCFIR